MQRSRSIRAILLVETRPTVKMNYARSKLPPARLGGVFMDELPKLYSIIKRDMWLVQNGIKRSKVTSRFARYSRLAENVVGIHTIV